MFYRINYYTRYGCDEYCDAYIQGHKDVATQIADALNTLYGLTPIWNDWREQLNAGKATMFKGTYPHIALVEPNHLEWEVTVTNLIGRYGA